MKPTFLKILLKEKRKILFLGGAGSGKSELAINFALNLRKLTDKEIHFFDMDQTKPLFRSREVREVMERNGLIFHAAQQLLDAPVIPYAVTEILNDENKIVVLDIGGNNVGALSIGQFSDDLSVEDTISFYVVNYYRPFSRDRNSILNTISQVKQASRINNISIISNPNLGKDTTLEDVIEGHEKTCKMLLDLDYEVSLLGVSEWLYEAVKESIKGDFLKVIPYIKYPWLIRESLKGGER